MLTLTAHAFAEQRIDILKEADLNTWKVESFGRPTEYRSTIVDNMAVVEARTDNSASGMVKKIHIDLTQTPYLNWRWRIDHVYAGNNERTKEGDDYPARIYVIVSGGMLFWKTRAINYVWSNVQPVGSHWPNAYTDNAQMLAIRTGQDDVGRWVTEKRNVRSDLEELFGKAITEIHAVAFMSDSDNHHQNTTTYYADIFFSSE